jgi:AcrR family transcriptional regulator
MKPARPARGRPRTFDREHALKSAMDVFWARGYDGASLEELQKAMGDISPPSFYAAFGSKDALFKEVVQRYRDTIGNRVAGALQASPVEAGIDAMMRTAVEVFLSNDAAPGCMVSLGALNSTRTNRDAHEQMRAMRCEGNEMIRQRLLRAVDEGELPKGLPLADIAGFYTTFIHGLAVRARDGATKSQLLTSVDGAMAAWPVLARAKRSPVKKKTRR